MPEEPAKLPTPEKFIKVEKIEKTEHKEKPEKFEHKEKPEKHEHKEKPEKFEVKEKPEKQEHKEKPEKFEHKETKIEHKDFSKSEIKESLKLERGEKFVFEGNPKDIVENTPIGDPGSPVEARLAALEQSVASLSHFITSGQRPDLSRGALKGEPDAKKTGG